MIFHLTDHLKADFIQNKAVLQHKTKLKYDIQL